MQSRYPDNETKFVFSQTLILEALAATDMTLPDLWDALNLTVIQRKNFFFTEPRVARMLRIQDFLAVDALSLVLPFDGLVATRKKPGLKTGGRPARFRPESFVERSE